MSRESKLKWRYRFENGEKFIIMTTDRDLTAEEHKTYREMMGPNCTYFREPYKNDSSRRSRCPVGCRRCKSRAKKC